LDHACSADLAVIVYVGTSIIGQLTPMVNRFNPNGRPGIVFLISCLSISGRLSQFPQMAERDFSANGSVVRLGILSAVVVFRVARRRSVDGKPLAVDATVVVSV
jgi:hypothetical protein